VTDFQTQFIDRFYQNMVKADSDKLLSAFTEQGIKDIILGMATYLVKNVQGMKVPSQEIIDDFKSLGWIKKIIVKKYVGQALNAINKPATLASVFTDGLIATVVSSSVSDIDQLKKDFGV